MPLIVSRTAPAFPAQDPELIIRREVDASAGRRDGAGHAGHRCAVLLDLEVGLRTDDAKRRPQPVGRTDSHATRHRLNAV